MSEYKFTPGEWIRKGGFVYALNEDGINRMMFHVQPGFFSKMNGGHRITYTETVHTAQVAQAAPDMLEALSSARNFIEEVSRKSGLTYSDAESYLSEIDSAIAKATGATDE